MKYLLTTLEYPPQVGGVAVYYANLISAWQKEDEWKVIDNSKNELIGPGRFGWLRSVLTLIKTQQKNKYDLVLIGQILPLGTAALIASLFVRLPYAVVLHGMDLSFALRGKRKRFISKFILGRAKHIICANSYVQKILNDEFPTVSDKIIVLNPGVVVGAATQTVNSDLIARYNLTGKRVLLSIGRLVERKGFDRVIDALSSIKEDNWVYLIAGEGPEKEKLMSQVAASNISANIKFIGQLNESEKWSCLDICDIFIMTSRDIDGDFEGFGIVYLEANIAGKPVIAGRSGGVADAVIHNETGLLINPENTDEIAQAIEKLLQNPQEASRLGENGRRRALQDFSWSGQAAKLKMKLTETNK
ncbi:MAG: glycosyltransferase family 4 protein [bacterium]|nr:glycosyltransferase family 4 protein [bacterium]